MGVPRIKEIISASKKIATPVITASLINDKNEENARFVKGRIEKTLLRDVTKYISEVYQSSGSFLEIKLNKKVINSLFLDIDSSTVVNSIISYTKLKLKSEDVRGMGKWKVQITNPAKSKESAFFFLQNIKSKVCDIIVSGIKTVERAVINNTSNKKNDPSYNLLVEGTDLRSVMTTNGVDGTETVCNNPTEIEIYLGIEAARSVLIKEIQTTMKGHSIDIDVRHMMLIGKIFFFYFIFYIYLYFFFTFVFFSKVTK